MASGARALHPMGVMIMRTLLPLTLVLCALGCAEKPQPEAPLGKSTVAPNRPTTSQALADASVAALKANNPDAALELVVTVFDIGRTCPKMNPKFLSHREKLITETKAAFTECAGMVDWSAAKVLEVKGGEQAGGAEDCEGAHRLQDILIKVESGAKKVEVKLDDPLAINGVVVLGEPGPKCKVIE